jgi:hypothetical protein
MQLGRNVSQSSGDVSQLRDRMPQSPDVVSRFADSRSQLANGEIFPEKGVSKFPGNVMPPGRSASQLAVGVPRFPESVMPPGSGVSQMPSP